VDRIVDTAGNHPVADILYRFARNMVSE